MKENYLKLEERLIGEGSLTVAGIDEAGRGSLAGPVVAAAVVVSDLKRLRKIDFRDSKKTSERRREELYQFFVSLPSVRWSTAAVSEEVIDKTNILEATKLAARRAVLKLEEIDALIIDGDFKIGSKLKEVTVIKGDERVISCKVAGMIAKVTRDRIMRNLAKRYPKYRFDKNKGYGTEEHFRMIRRYGSCPVHRKTFRF